MDLKKGMLAVTISLACLHVPSKAIKVGPVWAQQERGRGQREEGRGGKRKRDAALWFWRRGGMWWAELAGDGVEVAEGRRGEGEGGEGSYRAREWEGGGGGGASGGGDGLARDGRGRGIPARGASRRRCRCFFSSLWLPSPSGLGLDLLRRRGREGEFREELLSRCCLFPHRRLLGRG
ncbi:uncharacterized protein A4U43_C08F29920 [Asparagus officinalis]|nr:uncharacterized protein A4U43_C08F29920 [Asparagus officinalis]